MISDKELSSTEIYNLCFASYQLLQIMSNIYGSDPAYEMFQKFEEILGPTVKSHLFLKMLDSSYGGLTLHFKFINNQCSNMITMIKAVMTFAGSGSSAGAAYQLKEAKDIIDTAKAGHGTLIFTDMTKRNAFIQELKMNNGMVL